MARTTKKSPSYTAASEELEQILDEIETGNADVDVLSEKVARAAELIKVCREKLDVTEMSVKKVVDGLATEDPEHAQDGGEDA